MSTKEAVVTPNTQPKQPNESLVAKSLPIMLPLLLPILYAGVVALVRNSYVRFYSDYGVTPEDVGFEQGQVLSGIFRFCLAGNFLRSYTLLKIVILLAMLAAVFWVVTHYCTVSNRLGAAVPGTYGRVAVAIGIYASLVLLVILVSSVLVLPKDRQFASDRISKSEPVQPDELAFLMIHAYPAYVIPTGANGVPQVPPGFPRSDRKVMYLGARDGIAIIHEPNGPDSGTTWRIPQDAATIRLVTARAPLAR